MVCIRVQPWAHMPMQKQKLSHYAARRLAPARVAMHMKALCPMPAEGGAHEVVLRMRPQPGARAGADSEVVVVAPNGALLGPHGRQVRQAALQRMSHAHAGHLQEARLGAGRHALLRSPQQTRFGGCGTAWVPQSICSLMLQLAREGLCWLSDDRQGATKCS